MYVSVFFARDQKSFTLTIQVDNSVEDSLPYLIVATTYGRRMKLYIVHDIHVSALDYNERIISDNLENIQVPVSGVLIIPASLYSSLSTNFQLIRNMLFC